MIVPNESGRPQDAPPLNPHVGLFDALRASANSMEFISELADYIAAGGMPTARDREPAHRVAVIMRALLNGLKL